MTDQKNIWVAAADGDLARIQVRPPRPPIRMLIFPIGPRRATRHVPLRPLPSPNLKRSLAISPNAPDDFTYTPMHAAASYAQLDVLAYLVQQGNHPRLAPDAILSTILPPGGDVNITDEDGDTPLFTVENIDTAQWLIDHGAVIDWRNGAGVSVRSPSHISSLALIIPPKPIEHLHEDFPQVAAFLQSRLDPSAPPRSATSAEPRLSLHSQNAASETLTSNLIQSVSDIMQRAEAEGTDPDEELRAAVSRTVLEGVLTGYEWSTQDGADSLEDQNSKRPRMNGFHDP